MSNRGILQHKLATKDGASIDRQNDIQVLWNYYLELKSRHQVEDMQREQERLMESGTFNTAYDLSVLRNLDMFLSFGLSSLLRILDLVLSFWVVLAVGSQFFF